MEDLLYESHADASPGNASLANIVILSTAADGLSRAGRTSMYMEGGLVITVGATSDVDRSETPPLLSMPS